MSDATSDADRETPGPDEVYCRDCGSIISEKAEICPECGVRQRRSIGTLGGLVEELTGGGNPFVAAVLSVVLPGLGQLYNRELKKGIAVMVASLVALVSVVAFVGVILYPAVWLYAVWDAYVVADRQASERDADAESAA